MEHSGVAATDLSRHWRTVQLLLLPGLTLQGVVSFDDGLYWGRADPVAPPLYWADEFDEQLGAMAAVEAYIKGNRL